MPLNESIYRRKQREEEERRRREQAVEIARGGSNNSATSPQTSGNYNSTNSSTSSRNSSQTSSKVSQGTPAEKALFKIAGRKFTDRLDRAVARDNGTGNTNKTRTLDRTNERTYSRYDTEGAEKSNIRKNFEKDRAEFRKEHPVGRWLGAEGNNALWGLDAELAKGVDFFLPDVITPKKVQQGLDYYKKQGEEAQKTVEKERGGSIERTIAGTVGGESLKNIPSATMAYLSGGASVGAQVAGKAVPSLYKASELTHVGNTFTRALNEVAQTTGKNPMFWETFARTIGTTYENEIENGADPVRATLSAYTNALLNAQIEVGGGVEVYDPSEDFLKAVARSAKEEGLEEVEQYAVENLVNKAVGSNTARWLSLTRGQDAVINPVDMAEQGFYGALSGGLMSGGRTALANARTEAIDSALNPVSAEAVQQGMEDQRGLVNRGLVQERADEDGEQISTKAKSLAQDLQAQLDRGEALQPNQVKRLIREINKESNANEQSLERARVREVGKSLNEGSFVEETGLNLEQQISKQKDSALESRSKEKVKAILGENASDNEVASVTKVIIGTANSSDIDTVLTKPSLKNAVADMVNEGADADSKIQIPINNAEARTVLENLTAMKSIANRNAILKETQEENDEDIKALLTNLNGGGKDLFANHLAEGSNAIGDVYQNRFYRMYNEGRKDGADFEDAYDRLIAPLGSDVQAVFTRDFAQQIFAQGKASLATDNAKATAKSLAEKYANRSSGVTYENNDDSIISEAEKKGLETLAKAGNVEIRVMKNLTATDKDGKALLTKDGKELMVNGMYKDGTIYISANTKNKLVTVAKHELTHYIKEMSPERYKELEDFVLKKWYKNDPVAMAKRIEEYQRLYKDATPEEAREELIADASEAFFTDEATIEEAVSFSKKLGKAIHDGIKHILDAFTGDTRGYRGYGDFMKDLGILQEAERMWLEALEDTQQRKKNARGNVTAEDYVDASTQYTTSDEKHSLVESDDEIERLNSEPTQKSYRAMALIDGKLYPPMATKVKDKNGKWVLQQGADIGQWLKSDITTDPKMFNSNGQFILKKDNDDTIPASYNPYIHSSDTMLNDQFATAYKRPNIVVVEGEIPTGELTNGKRAEHDLDDGRHIKAKDPTGTIQWKPGIVQGKLTGTRTVFLTNHFKPTRVVPDSEVARSIQDMVKGTDVAIPYNVVTPSLRKELQKLGAKMEQSKQKAYQVDLDEKYSVTAESDQAYMDAVNRGDMETAQRMVDEQAKRNGYNIKVFHGTPNETISASRGRVRGDDYKKLATDYADKLFPYVVFRNNGRLTGIYTSTDRGIADAFSYSFSRQGTVYDLYARADKPFTFDAEGNGWNNIPINAVEDLGISKAGRITLEDVSRSAKEQGYDAVVVNNVRETGSGDNESPLTTDVIVFSGNQLKSADPVTYDDDGNVIPLSQRFNDENEDIRWSVSEDSDGNKLSEGQREYFKDSKVRDENGNLLKVYHGTGEEFYEFSRDQIGRHGSFEGAGFNFTPSEARATGYAYSTKEGKVLGGYLNITNPLSNDKVTFTANQLAKIIRDIDPTGDDIIANYAQETRDYGKPSFIERESLYTARQMLKFHDSDVDIYSDLSASGSNPDAIISAFQSMGYDGLIHYNPVWGNGKFGGDIKTLIAFDSNQFKLADNLNPTEDKDIRYSLSSSFEAVGCDIRKEDGLIRAYDGNGNEVTKFKPSDIRKSPLGRLLSLAVGKKILSDSDVNQQVDFLSRLYNMILNTQDPDLIWAVSGTIGYDPKHGIGKTTGWLKEAKSKFASITGNADPQYKTTIDFTTICVKTQAIIDAMSKVMIDLGRGLTEHEIIDIVYKETAMAGEQVPCPVCYVFSRWVGLGNLFGKIKEFQQDYPEDMDMTEVRKEYEAIKKEVDKLVKEQTGKKSSGKAREQLYKETIERKDLLDLKDQMPNKKLTEAERKELEDLNRRLDILDHWSWLEKTRLADDYKAVPDDVLFDLNAGRTFATDYPATWRFRTIRGPALGKAVAPYSPSRLGDTIRGIASPSTLAKLGNSKRVFLNPNSLTSTAKKAYDKAIANAKRQNRMNGQRLQSTSDFRFEYGLDYLLSFIELEAIGAKAQMYTKVPEAVKFLASTGTEVNCSIMAKGSGLDENGNLIFSDITGMAWEDALMLSQMYDNVQPILVAIGREHLIKAMAHKAITMIIPYHASGSSESRYRSMMEAVGEAVEDRTDFAEYENEHDRDDATPEQKLCRKLRVDILTGKYANKELDSKERTALKNNDILRQLYIRIYGKDINGNPAKPNRKYVENYDKDGNDADCYGVYLTKEQAGVMMPYEYWDKHSTVKDADKQGEAYIKYCESLGITPVFSGWDSKGKYDADMDFSSYTGYWKTLIDRCMYNNDGTYHKQQAVNVRNVDLDMLDSDEMKNGIFKPMQAQNAEKTKTIAERAEAVIAQEAQTARASVSEVEDSEYGRLQKENETLKEAVWERNEQISVERMRAEMDVQRERRRGTERKRKAVNETRERYEARIKDLKEQQKERERKAKERREEAERKQKEHRKQVHERASARRRASEERARQERQEQRDARREKKQDSEARTRLLNIARRLSRIKSTDEFNRIRDQLIGNLDLEAKSMTGKTKMKLEDLEKWYQDQVENNDWFVKNERLEKKFERLRKTHISDMSLEDVQNLTEILLMLEHKVRNDKKLINSQYKKDVFMASFETAEGIKQSKGLKFKGLHKVDNIFIGQVLSPIRYMRRLTGYDEDNPLMIATRELQKGEIASLDYRRRALEPFLKFTDMKFTSYLNGNKAPEIEVNATTIDMKPTTVKITPAIRIWLYLSSMNADNMRHIVNGGVRIPDVKLLKKGKRTDAYDNGTLVRFSKSQVQAIIDGMTSKEEAYAKAVFNYFNKVAPEATNAVSETLDGISIAKVKNYVPIHVDDTFLDVEGDTIKMDGTVEGMGSHKERVQSSKPAYAEDVSDLLMRSIDADMKYVGMAIPLRNFGKIYRSSSMESARGQAEHIELTGETNNSPSTLVYGDEQTATYRTRTGGYVSVRDAIRSLWTSDATKYIDKFLSDLQFPHSQVGEVERTLRELTSNYAGAVLTLNASVAIKQSASYPTAGAVLGWKPLIKAFTKVGKLDLDYANSVTPLLAYRAEGFNFREAGDIQNRDGRDSWFKRIMRTPLFNWIQGMDLLTTRKLFKASEIYVQDKYHLKRGQSGYDEKVAEIFNKVITETQPNYTVMERAGHLRSDSTLERTLSMFKTQPYQNFNIWYDATGDYLDKRDAYKKAKTKANREALKEASVNLGNATTSQIAQLAVFAVMTSLWALARGKDDKWRDEEGNLSFASYLKQLAHDMIGGVASEFFLGSDVFSALDSVINDSYYSGFSSVTDSSINDFFNTGMDMTKLLQQAWDYAVKGNEEEIDTDKLLKQMEKVVTEGGRFSGIPTGNLINLKNLMYRWVCVSKDGEYIGEYEAMKMSFAKDTYKKELLKRAYRNDKKAYEELRQMMIDDGMKESTLDKYINDSARENPTEEQTNSYKRSLTFLEGNRLWYNNDSVYIEDYDNALRDIALGIDTDDTDRLKKLESVGISPEENVLIRLAMEKADILYGDKNGTLNKDEKLQALEMVRSSLTLTDKEKEEILKTSFSFGKGKKKS